MASIDYFEDRRSELSAWIASRMPQADAVALTAFSPATSGFSNVTLFTELTWTDSAGAHRRELVLRAVPPGRALFPDDDLRLQYDVMAALHGTAVPVPQLAWYLDDLDVLGVPAYLMDRVRGEVASGYRPGFHGHGLFFDATLDRRRSMWFAAVDVMASLHRLDPLSLRLPDSMGSPADGRDAITAILARIRTQLDSVGAEVPVLWQALDELGRTMPDDMDVVLCWGDARPGNVIYRDGEVVAALDWELAHYGAPEGDLAYFLLVDEVVAELNNVPGLSGLPDAAETIAHYQHVVGRDLRDLEYHRILQALRMAAMLVLTVQLSPPELEFPPDYLTENVPTRRLAQLLRVH
ncbi:phosphotransferase family protein [Mycobacterium sp. 050134]|uniref:phosphotransferase family protein n=1 Tax=Mycobacterium sp. 050134 TaxID=3096111 RepID=UPI002EDA0BE2